MDKYEKVYKESIASKAYWQAIDGINIKENEQIVLEYKTFWSYYFSRDIEKADIKAHEQIILELKDPEYCYSFARNISKTNVEEHFKVIVNSGSKYWLDRFIERVNYKNTKVEEWLLYI